MKADEETITCWIAIISSLLGFVMTILWVIAVSENNELRKQRDEAYELARKAQNSAMYWYDVHEKMVWHTQPNEENED